MLNVGFKTKEGKPMKFICALTVAALLSSWLAVPPVFAQGAGIEWDILNQEVTELYRAGNYGRAVVVAKKALQVAEANAGKIHPMWPSLNNLAQLYATQGQYAQAEPLYKRTLAIKEKALGPDHPDVATSLNNLAALYRATNRGKEAEVLEQQAVRILAIQR
jgi:tetratricopeptide (TPR) repeat protein